MQGLCGHTKTIRRKYKTCSRPPRYLISCKKVGTVCGSKAVAIVDCLINPAHVAAYLLVSFRNMFTVAKIRMMGLFNFLDLVLKLTQRPPVGAARWHVIPSDSCSKGCSMGLTLAQTSGPAVEKPIVVLW